MALTILTAGLAACGLLLLLWSVAEAMLLPLPREDAVLVAPLQGGAAEVERQIRGCRWMREQSGQPTHPPAGRRVLAVGPRHGRGGQ